MYITIFSLHDITFPYFLRDRDYVFKSENLKCLRNPYLGRSTYIIWIFFANLLFLILFQEWITVWCNQMETVIVGMSSWTAPTWYTVRKTAFRTKNMKSESLSSLLWRYWILRVIEEYAYLKKYSTYQQGTHKIGF